MKEIKEKTTSFKPKIRTTIKIKTSGELMKIKVMKNMAKRTVKYLSSEAKILNDMSEEQVQTADNNSRHQKAKDSQERIKVVGKKSLRETKTMAVDVWKHKDYSKLRKDMGKLKKEFKRDKIRIKMSSNKKFKAYEVRNNAENAKQSVKQSSRAASSNATSGKVLSSKVRSNAPKRGLSLAKKEVQSLSHRKAIQIAKVAAKRTQYMAKKIEQAVVQAVRMAFLLLSGSGFLIAFIAIFAIVGAIVGSPFGIFYSGEDKNNPDVIPISAVVGMLNADFSNALTYIQETVPHDSVTIDGTMADWCEVLAVFAVKANEENDVVTIDEARVGQIKGVFWDMNSLTYNIEVIVHDDYTERILHIHIHHKTEQEMREVYAFTPQQIQALEGILEYRSALLSLMGNLNEIQGDAQSVIDSLPNDLSEDRRNIVLTACSLVGKVNYFWGGKWNQIGWNPEWGSMRKVTSDGSKTTGTMRVYRLDCSGYVTWVFINTTGDASAGDVVGHGAGNQYRNCAPIDWSEAQIGDLVCYEDLSHIGIIVGINDNGFLIAHCVSGANNVVITSADGFSLVGRPSYFVQ